MRVSLSAKVAVGYFIIANLWRFSTDEALLSLLEPKSASELVQFQAYRTLLFTSITALIVYQLFNYFLRRISNSRKQYQQLFEQNPNPMWVYCLRTLKFLAVNDAAIASYGYTRDEFMSMTIRDIRPPDDIEKLHQAISNRQSGFYSSGIWRHKKKNGELISVKISSHPIQFESHDAELILSVDVTNEVEYENQLLLLNQELENKVLERTQLLQKTVEEMETLNEELKATNEELLSSNEALVNANETIQNQARIIERQNTTRLQDTIESISDAFITLDHDLCIVRANKAFEELVLVNRTDVLGKNFYKVFPQALTHIIKDHISIASSEKRQVTFETYSERLEKHLRIRVFPITEGLVINATNINDEIKQREEVLLAKKNLDLLINNTKDIIWSIDKNLKLLNANTMFYEVARKATGIILKPGDHVLDPKFGESYISEWKEYYERALHGESFTITTTYTSEEEIRHLTVHINPILSDDNKVMGVGCFGFDVTDQRKMEFERNRMIDQLTQQNKNLEEFSYIISHNLRSPVASIKGLVDIIQHDAPDRPRMLEMLNRSAHKLDEVITDLNKVLEARNIIAEQFEPVNLGDVIENIEALLEQQILKTKTTLHCNFDKLSIIQTSKPYITSILLNLITNSIKYRKDNDYPLISISSALNAKYYVLKVSDNGMGIDLNAFKHKLFQLYQRFHLHVEGKGLGLYLVKTQVEALGGSIDVDSALDVGTTFTIKLPIAKPNV